MARRRRSKKIGTVARRCWRTKRSKGKRAVYSCIAKGMRKGRRRRR